MPLNCPALLVRPFQAILSFFKRPFLDTDNFTQSCRKHIVVVGMIVWVFQILNLISTRDDWKRLTAGLAFVRHAEAIAYILVLPIPFYRMHRTRHVTDSTGHFLYFSCLFISLYQAIRDANTNSSVFVPIVCISGVISDVGYAFSLCVFGVGIIALHYYNLLVATPGSSRSYIALSLPDPWGHATACNESTELIMVLYVCVNALMIYVVYVQTRAFRKQISVATTSTEVAIRVSHMLRQYRTKDASILLMSESDGCDPYLIEVLGVITKNMEAYKPYLPNYLLRRKSVDEGGDDPCTPVTNTTPHSTTTGKQTCETFESLPDNIALQSIVPPEATRVKSPLSPPGQTAFTSDCTFHTRNVTAAQLSFRGAYAFLEYEAARGDVSLRKWLGEFIETVHVTALNHKAAVHSFFGDNVLMTWNVSSRCVDHYYRGVVMLWELCERFSSTQMGGDETLNLYGSVVSGPSRCERGGTSTFAWTLHSPLMFEELQAVHKVASQAGGIFMSKSHADQIEHSTRSQAIDALPLDAGKKHGHLMCVVHEIVFVVSANNKEDSLDDEWMYKIQSGGGEGGGLNVQVTECLRTALAGNVSGGLTKLEELIACIAECNVTKGMKHLQQRLKDMKDG